MGDLTDSWAFYAEITLVYGGALSWAFYETLVAASRPQTSRGEGRGRARRAPEQGGLLTADAYPPPPLVCGNGSIACITGMVNFFSDRLSCVPCQVPSAPTVFSAERA